MTRIVFLGSPEFAVPTLRKLNEQFHVVGVVTQPDRPSGRGQILKSPPVKRIASELNLPVIQPRKISEPEAMHQLHAWAPDLIVVAAFGQILRSGVLDLPIFGCVNVHASLLPRWRGAAPIQAAILNGDEQTGITIMRMDPGIDTGPILSQASIPLSAVETAGSLGSTLSNLGAEKLINTLPGYLDGSLAPNPRDDSLATYAPMIKKEAGLLDFSQPATVLERKVRAFNPWPGAYTFLNNGMLKIHRTHITEGVLAPPGNRIIRENLPAYTTGQGILVIDHLQPAGKNLMDGITFLRGARRLGGIKITAMIKPVHISNIFCFTILRHGESQGNYEGRHQGQADFPLTDLGRQQTRALVERWKSEQKDFSLIISSPLARASETAEIISTEMGFPIELDPLWMERDNGLMAGTQPRGSS